MNGIKTDTETAEKKPSVDYNFEIDVLTILRSFVKGCVRFWWLIAVLGLLGGTVNYYREHTSYVPYYRSEVTFTVTTSTEEALDGSSYNFYYDSATAEQLGLTFPHILSSQLLSDAMKEDMGVDRINGTVSVTTISESNMVTMYANSPSPEDAKSILESAIRVYPAVSRFVIGETKFNMIDPPSLPTTPVVQPNYRHNLILGAAIGFFMGFVLVAIYALFRKTVHKSSDIRRHLSLECLTTLPLIKPKKRTNKGEFFPTPLKQGINPWFFENMETLRLRVEKRISDKENVILVTSTLPSEGKSLVASNLAFKLAKHGKKVLLVDGDLRKQNLAEILKIEIKTELSQIDADRFTPDLMTEAADYGIFFLGGSKPVSNASRFYMNNLSRIIKRAKKEVDYVIIDVPPAGSFEDVFMLKEYSDKILYVIKQDYAAKSKIIETVSLLEEEGADIMGYVFNGTAGVLGTYGNYGYVKYGRYGHYGKYGKYARYGYGEIKEN